MENVMARPKEEWLKEYSKASIIKKYTIHFKKFCEWAKVNDVDLVEEYRKSDPREFAKKWGTKIVQYYNDMIKQGYSSNYARTLSIAPRAFFKSQCIELKIKKGAIQKPRIATGEHEFLLSELQAMYRIGDIEDKARLATAISLGWGAQDFVRLEWSFVEPYLDEKLEPPVAFWHEREKTGSPTRAHLTHEAIEALRELRRIKPEDKYLFTGYNGTYLSEDGLNAWLKSLTRKAKIKTRGKLRFHLIRKFLMSQLSSSGMNAWETKLCVGKSIPSDILTYLKNQGENLRQKYMNAEPRFTLTGYTNTNHSKIEKLEEEVMLMKETLQTLAKILAPLVAREIKRHGGFESYPAYADMTPKARANLQRLVRMRSEEEE